MDPFTQPGPLLEDFGQKVDLTRRIREVLVNYPEGTTVLKELIQNADDAGATKVCLCLDRRSHGTESLLSPALGQWQGPALLAYNDAVFTEDDFVSISRIGDSKKQGQAWKTGRFGVGFNSVYHLTDLPSFVSDKYVVMFDPQGAYLPNVSAANPGKRLDYVSSSVISLYKDQFVPYCAFGCDMTRPFHGTLFRFPLRSADQAAVSKLSRQAYAEDDISSMFFQLYKEAVFSLLFLKSVISVETYIWEAGVNEAQKMYSCSVMSPNENMAWHRQALVRFSASAESSNSQMDSFSLEFLSETTSGTILEKRIDKFFIVQAMASASSKLGAFATMAGKEYDLHLLPWASIAAHVSDSSSEDTFLKQGLAFCFLPLPVRTGLTVQVNGYFEVSSNRRSIWFGTDMDRGGKLRSDWNRLLLEDAVAPAFRELLLSLRKLLGPTNLYYSLWPSGSFEEPWDILVEHIYKLIYLSPVLHSDAGGGKWISPAEAYIHDFEFCRSTALREALILLGMPIVNLPKVLVGTFFKYYIDLGERRVSPETVRHFLKRCRILCSLSSSYKFILLDYILGDLSDTDVAKHANGLPLIPLANGKFGNISEASQGTRYYICDELEYQLLSVVSDKVIDRNIPFDLFHRLSQIASGFKANLAILDGQNFLQLFPRLFPAEWKYKNRVSWNPESGTSGPMAAWFVHFWQYLQDRSYDLSIFSEWPIFPSTSGHLYRASKSSKLLNAENLSSTMKNLLAKIGCKIVNPIYGVRHPDLALYVYDGDAAGVLSSIFESLPSDDLHILFQEFSADEKTELYQFFINPKWYYGGILSDLHIKSCRKLPIFRVHGGGDTCNPYFANLDSPEKYLPPADIPEYFLGGEFILSTTLCEEEILVRYYGIERMQKAYFYKYHVLNRLGELQQEMRDIILLNILKELPQLSMDDSSFKESLRALEFVPTMNGSLNSPQSLYDPRVEELYALLEESDCFPCGLFQEPGILDMLLLLGLRTSVSSETIIQSARQIESLMHKDQFKANLRGKVLLSYLEVNAGKWLYNASFDSLKKAGRMLSKVATAIKPRDVPLEADLEKFWTDLRMICWCPVMTAAPHSALPWPSVSSMVAPPKLVRLQADMWLVSASRRILDGECSSSALSFGLGWSSPPGGSVIAAQMLELGKNNEIVTDQMLRQELALAMPKIYSLLTNLIGSDEMDIVKAVLEGCRWIWVGDGFATVTEVVLSGHLHLAPYIRVIPVDLAVFRELFLELGVKEYLKPMDYAEILCRMASRKNCSPLDGPELRAAILVVQHLAEVQFQDLQVQIYLPDISSRLIPAVDLVFNDAPWLLDLGENTSNASLNPKINVHNFVHGNISNDVAEKLGVRSLRRLLLAESSDSMNLSLSGAAEAFGQHEALTTRLKHIVEMYADGPGILFELVQNAEDARASEVVFLLDKTQYGTSSILSPELAEWQGPALYCFNNSVFTPHDLYAISRIGQDSKLEKPCAIGRFGLGFNCVYHFTDIPSFVSGDNIVLFDPHACYLPGISPTHPGLRIKFVGRRILDQFPDQFSPFLHFGCDLQQSFPGTLFRFPLRSETAASRSQIKKEKYASVDVELLFSSFSELVAETLLFLRNVQKISVFVKEGPSHEMQLVHCVSKQSVSGLGKEPHPLNAMLNFINGRQQKGMDKDQFLNKLGKTLDRELPWHCQKVVVMEQSPYGCTSHHWIISECIGGGNAKSKSLSLNRSHNFFPWGSVAAYMYSVSVNGSSGSTNFEEVYCSDASFQHREDSMQSRKKVEGRAFCFLPLPVVTGLPVHINAYFELSSNRRDIWFGNDMAGGGKIRSEWNICLLEDVISPAYGRLLACIAEEIGPSDLFFTYWPTSARLEPWASMVHKLYLSIADLGIPVLYTKARGGQWISTRQAILPDFTFPNAFKLSEALSAAGLPMVTVPEPIVNRFMEACPSLHFLNPSLLRTLLIRRKRAFNDKEAILITLEYCLSDMKGSAFSDNLLGLPLVPLATGSFSMFSKRGEGERIFIASPTEYDLLKDYVPHLLVDCLIPSGIFNKLQAIAHSGLTNIFEFTCHTLVELFHRILPVEWQHAKQVNWVPNQQSQPSLEWMGLLWSYLKSSCIDLKMFSQWPILPVGRDQLFQLSESSNVIRDEGWSENMTSLLHKVGCVFLRSDLTLDHPQLKNFIQDATASGILNAMQSVCCNLVDIKGLFLNASRGEMHELRSFILQSKWFSTDQIDSKLIESIKQLPIFESYKTTELISLTNPTKWLKPEGIHEDLLDGSFIRTESDRERNILRCYIGIKEASRAEFYREHVLNHMSRFLSQPSMLSAILHDVKLLMEQDTSLRTAVSKIPFVLAADGSWKHPSRLYDPRAPGLQNLLHREVFFPCDKFSDDNILEILTNLGLKRALSFTGLLDSARSVSMLHDSGHMDALTYTRRLLVYLNALGCKLSPANGESRNHDTVSLLPGKDDSPEEDSGNEVRENWYGECDQDVHSFLSNFVPDISEDEFWSELKTIAWCPVYVSPPFRGLPWLTSDNHVAPPNITRPKSQMWMVSAKMRILDCDCCATYIHRKLGWLDSLDVEVLSTQLVELSKSYNDLNLKHEQEQEPSIDSVLEREMPLIYSKLQGFIGTDDFDVLKESLDGVCWVWIGDNFISPKALAFDSPVKYHPYLYAVPSELSQFRDLLSNLGVKLTFDAMDYLRVLQCLKCDLKGESLTAEQLSFVHRVLEAFVDCSDEKQLNDASMNLLLIPDSFGVLMHPSNLVYNDAPWLEKNGPSAKHFVHPCITNDLAKRLGAQSLRCSSLVDEEMTGDLPCMDYARICDLLAMYGDNDSVLFDLLELADCCKAKKMRLIYDKREHPRQSLLQHNLGDFQGPSLTVVLEGAALSREDLCCLQFPPPWKIQGNALNYGLGLISSYFICDLLKVISSGYFFIFDPLGLALAATSSSGPSAKLFSLIGTGLLERFHDQFSPMLISQGISLSSSDSTVIRMPLSSKCLKELENGSKRVKLIFDRFKQHASSSLLFLKSVLQVSLSTWEEGNSHPSLDYSVSINSPLSIMRNPFSEKKWRKFQLYRLFSTSTAAIKMHVIDVHAIQSGRSVIDKWLVVLCLGSGQTRNMALDRRYLAYNLTPVAGVAAHISQNGQPMSAPTSSCILSPLPLSGTLSMPVTALGCFLVCHKGGRYLFNRPYEVNSSEHQSEAKSQLAEAWNKELLLCVRDAYVEMVLEFQKLRKDPLTSSIESNAARAMSFILQAYGDKIYYFWPKSRQRPTSGELDAGIHDSGLSKATEADWESLIEQVIRPFYVRLVDLPVWQLYNGNAVKSDEGMFLSQPGSGNGDSLPPSTVCSFIKEHYPVFSVPWELVRELQAVGVKVREIKPKMVRNLLKSSKSVIIRSIEAYIDVLDYCLSDIQLQHSSELVGSGSSASNNRFDDVSGMPVESLDMSIKMIPSSKSNMPRSQYGVSQSTSSLGGGDALEMVTYFGRALYDFGRGVVEDIGRAGGPLSHMETAGMSADGPLPSIAVELKGMPFPTATNSLARLGITELWVGNKDQQLLMRPLADKFIHIHCLEKALLAEFLSDQTIHKFLKLKSFSSQLLSVHMRHLFDEQWVNQVVSNNTPWIQWDSSTSSTGGGPTPKWIHLFWKVFKALKGDLSFVSDWPLIPAFLNRPVLCRIKENHLVFVPPIIDLPFASGVRNSNSEDAEVLETSGYSITESDTLAPLGNDNVECELSKSFELMKSRYPWLLGMLNQLNIPVYDMTFVDSGVSYFFPAPVHSLAKVILSKLISCKHAGYLAEPVHFLNEDRDRLFTLFVADFTPGFVYKREEVAMLRELPMYKTVTGTYTKLSGTDQCFVSPAAFFHPHDERCLSHSMDSSLFLCALGVKELNNQELLVKFALPGFEQKNPRDQEDILLYLYMNWKDLHLDSSTVDTLKETKFVRNAVECCLELFKPSDLLDPSDPLLTSVFSGEQNRFPEERFASDGWLQILRKAGLRTSSQADMIVECAKKVELLGKRMMTDVEDSDDFEAEFSGTRDEVSFELWSLAGSVVDSLFSNFATLYDHSFCEKIGKIAFVPSERGFPSIGGKKGGKRVLASFVEAILLKDWPLAWSSAPIITKQNVIPPEYSWGAFHFRSPPVFSIVLKHLQVIGRNNGEDTLAHWPTTSGMMTIEEASFEILKYLHKIWGTLSSSEMTELQKVAFIPVANGTRLVTAKSLFVRLTSNLAPFAFELPSLYLPFVKILKEIGIQEVLTIAYARDLLLNIQKSCGYQHLNPNELRAVMEILNFICDGESRTRSERSEWIFDAIVPDDGCRLVLARSCVYVDPYGSQFLGNIETSRLRFSHPELSENICLTLGIKKLSDVVIEDLDDELQLQVVDQIGTIPVTKITEKLLSKSFQDAVWILVNSLTIHFPQFKGQPFAEIQSLLGNIAKNLQFVHVLHTRFLLLPKYLDVTRKTKNFYIPEWEGSRKHQAIHFVDKSKVRILVANPPSYMSINDVIAVVISQILEAPTTLPIGLLLACPDGSEKAILNALKLGSEIGMSKNEGMNGTLAGKELLPQDALLVQFLPMRPFYAGEIVAWKTGMDGDTLRYGRVPEDVRPTAGQALYRLPVETAHGEAQVLLSTQIFSFKSVAFEDEASMSCSSEASEAVIDNRVLHIQENKDCGNGKIAHQAAKELQYGKVSSTEIVQAVHDMLSAAGINMDAEKQTLLQTTLTLQEQVKDSQVALLVEQERADAAIKEADAAKAAWSCRICLSAEVNTTIVPCGHVLCHRCSSAVTRCPFCRSQVSKTMKIFRP